MVQRSLTAKKKNRERERERDLQWKEREGIVLFFFLGAREGLVLEVDKIVSLMFLKEIKLCLENKTLICME